MQLWLLEMPMMVGLSLSGSVCACACVRAHVCVCVCVCFCALFVAEVCVWPPGDWVQVEAGSCKLNSLGVQRGGRDVMFAVYKM